MKGSKPSHWKNVSALLGAIIVIFAIAPAGEASSAGGWQKIPDLPRQINVLLAEAESPGVVYAGTGLSGSGSGVYKTEDLGLTWNLASEGLSGGDVVSLALQGGILYAAASSGYVFASTDGAERWDRLGYYGLTGFAPRMAVASSDGDVLFVAKDVRGVAFSLDGGYTWMSVEEGLPEDVNGEANVQSVAIDPNDPDVIYLGTGWNGFNGNGVYKSADRGDTWRPANRGMLDYSIASLAIDQSNPDILYAGGYKGDLFKSRDGAETWNDLTDRIPLEKYDRSNIKEILLDPREPETVYVLSERHGVFVSRDGGLKWSALGAPTEVEYPTFTAMTVLLEPEPAVFVGIRDEGGWRRSIDQPARGDDGAVNSSEVADE